MAFVPRSALHALRRRSSGRLPALRQAASVGLPVLVGLGLVLAAVALGSPVWPGLARAVFDALDSATGLAVLFACGLAGRLILPLVCRSVPRSGARAPLRSAYPAPRTARASSARVPRGPDAR